MTTPTPSAKARDAYYTIPPVARQCYELLRPFLDSTISLLEPSAGGGAFVDAAAQHRTVVALDIAPASGRADIQTADFLQYDLTAINAAWGAWATIGNPAFGRRSELALEFLNRSLQATGLVGFILPRVFRRWSMQAQVTEGARLLVDVDLPKRSFTLEGHPRDIGCVFQVWSLRHSQRVDLRLTRRPACCHPDFKGRLFSRSDGREIDWSWATMAVKRVGGGSYAPVLSGQPERETSTMILLRAHGRVQERLLSIDYDGISHAYTTHRGLSLADVVSAYELVLAAELANDNVLDLRKRRAA